MPSPTTSGAAARVRPSGSRTLDALLADSGDGRATKWGGGPAGTGATLTYSFPDGGSPFVRDYSGGEPGRGNGHLVPLTPTQQEAARAALAAWSAVADVRFVEVAESAAQVGDIRLAASTVVDPATYYAYAYLPGGAPRPEAGDVWLSAADLVTHDDYTVTPAGHGYFALLHELGHAVFGFTDVSKSPGLHGAVLPAPDDGVKYTVMSYEPSLGPGVDRPTTPMPLDIAAAQYLYGPNLAQNAGDTVYRWGAGERIFATLWDGGGRDTIDWSNQATAARIDLREGAYSELGPPVRDGTPEDDDPETLAIALGAVIEDAIGGAGDDEIIGNPRGNTLRGGRGDDVLKGGPGDDRLHGGPGKDTLNGGAGDDRLLGGAGDDSIVGGLGSDVLTGGGGADRFAYSAGNAGVDRITDFEPGAGGDVLDLAELLVGFEPGASDPAAYIALEDDGAATTVGVAAGSQEGEVTPPASVDVAVLEGVSGVSVGDLLGASVILAHDDGVSGGIS